MTTIDPIAVPDAFAAGRTYRFVVPSSLQWGVLEDILTDFKRQGVGVAGYDIHPHRCGCIVELRESGECMVAADLEHVDLRLLTVGEPIDHFVDFDGTPSDIL